MSANPSAPSRAAGVGRVLVAVYAILAIAATGRSVFQIIDRFAEAPVAFTLSALAAVVYIVATISLALGWRRTALLTICFELAGVLVIGTLSVAAPALLGLHSIDPFGRAATVWSVYGAGYVFVPLVLPVLGLLYLLRLNRRRRSAEAPPPAG
jgi:cytochrome bd-type quinol oxidase subunit 2